MSAFWIYKDKLLEVEETNVKNGCSYELHFLEVLKHPEFFDISEDYLKQFCKCFGFDSIEDLMNDFNFLQEDNSDAWEELIADVLERGALRCRQHNDYIFIHTFDLTLKTYREIVMNALIDFEGLFPNWENYRIFDIGLEHGVSVRNKNDAIEELLESF